LGVSTGVMYSIYRGWDRPTGHTLLLEKKEKKVATWQEVSAIKKAKGWLSGVGGCKLTLTHTHTLAQHSYIYVFNCISMYVLK